MSDKISSGRLYLQRDGKQDIHVDFHIPLLQHQINGVRFLYKQFKKKRQGVILNDPSGYGKCLQTVLFLSAMRTSLNKPIFILCDEENFENWKEHFQKWTDFDDVMIQSSNPFTKSMVYINSIKDASSFCRPNWSVVIVHDNNFFREKLQTTFKADFKIWITSEDMKENLGTFSQIYQWLNPNSKFNIEEFTPIKNIPRDIIEKAILLNAFLEDVVIRRNDFITPFKSKNRTSKGHSITESPKKVSKKNKDPTGHKVKRSKLRTIYDDDDDFEISVENNANVTIPNEFTNIVHHNEFTVDNNELNNEKSNEMDIECFIRDNKPLQSNEMKEFYLASDNTSQQSVDSTTNTQSNTLNEFQNALNEIIANENKTQDYNMDPSGSLVTKIHSQAVTMENTLIEEASDTQDSFTITNREVNIKLEEENIPESQKTDHLKVKSDLSKKDKNNKEENKSKSCTDDKLSELEEQALKKFKGSFLDRIF